MLFAFGLGTASAGCSDEIASLEKVKAANFNLASAPDPKVAAKLDELIERARVADRAKREQECLEAIKEANSNALSLTAALTGIGAGSNARPSAYG